MMKSKGYCHACGREPMAYKLTFCQFCGSPLIAADNYFVDDKYIRIEQGKKLTGKDIFSIYNKARSFPQKTLLIAPYLLSIFAATKLHFVFNVEIVKFCLFSHLIIMLNDFGLLMIALSKGKSVKRYELFPYKEEVMEKILLHTKKKLLLPPSFRRQVKQSIFFVIGLITLVIILSLLIEKY